jgi:PAS domain S-box-containing protein
MNRLFQHPAFYKVVFVLSLFLLLFVSALTYRQLEAQNESERLVRESASMQLELEKLFSSLKDAETGQRGYVITRDSNYLQPYFFAQSQVGHSFRSLDRLVDGRVVQKHNIAGLKVKVDDRFRWIRHVIALTNSNKGYTPELFEALRVGRRKMYDIRVLLNSMIQREEDRLRTNSVLHRKNVVLTPLTTFVFTFFSLIVFILAFVRINRDNKKMAAILRKDAEVKILEESERAYRQMIQGLPAALYLCDETGRLLDYNDACVTLWGYAPEKGSGFWCGATQAFDGQGRPLSAEYNPVARVLRGESVPADEMTIIRPNGDVRIVLPYPQVIRGAAGEIKGALNMYFDITDLKHSQKALADSEIRLRVATESAGMATWDLDMQTKNLVYSERMNELFGLPSGTQLTQDELRSYIFGEDMPIIARAQQTALENGLYSYVVRIRRADGPLRYIQTDGKVIFDDNGQAVRMLGTMSDVTAQRLHQKQLEDSERLFRTIALSIPNSLVVVIDTDYKIISLEGDLLSKLGYDSQNFVGKSLQSVTEADKFARDKENYDRLLSGEKFSLEITAEAEKLSFMTHFVPLKDNGETYAGLIIALDITELKTNEERIARFGAIVESSDDGIFSLTLDGFVTSWNRGAERIFGYTEKEMVGMPLSTIIPPDRRDEETRILSQIREGRSVDHFETIRLRKDGREVDISLTVSPLKNDEGTIIGASKISRDISERKRTERQLVESEERFRTLIDAAPVLVWMSGTDKLCTFFNKAWLDFTGRTMEQETGDGWMQGIHPEDSDRCVVTYYEAFDRREEFYIEYRMRRHDGEYRWISDKGVPRFAPDGSFLGYIGGCMDIQESKDFASELERIVSERTNELRSSNFELNRQKELAETVLDTAIDINLVYDRETRFLAFNKAAELIYGRKKEEVIGRKLLDVFPSAEGSKGYNDLMRALQGEQVHNTTYKSPVTGLYYEDFLIPMRRENGEVFAVLVFARNITESIRNEQLLTDLNNTLRSKNAELERSNAELASFNHVASHDLQEPLRKIQTFISRIFDTGTDDIEEKNLDYLRRIQLSANRMQLLIDDLLTFSRTNKADQKHVSVDLNNTLENVQRELSQSIEEHNAEIVVGERLPTVSGIAFQFHQLFVNLIGNALKYTEPDKQAVVTISCRTVEGSEVPEGDDRKYYRIGVKDNGIGFDMKYAVQIFELFQRLHGRTEYSGTGIGLTICKKIVENHNGKIMAESKPGEGSEFIVFLPV